MVVQNVDSGHKVIFTTLPELGHFWQITTRGYPIKFDHLPFLVSQPMLDIIQTVTEMGLWKLVEEILSCPANGKIENTGRCV